MKTSSESVEGKRIDRPTAWACTVTNALTLPGLGTLAAGRRVGFIQAGLAMVGFAASVAGLGLMVRDWLAQGELPLEITLGLRIGLAGILAYAAAWFWALASSLGLHRQARNTPSPQPPPESPPKLGSPTSSTHPVPPVIHGPKPGGGTRALLLFLGLLAGLGLARGIEAWQVPVPRCLLKSTVGIPCAFCGSTRAVMAAARLELGEALRWNPLTTLAGLGLVVGEAMWVADRWFGFRGLDCAARWARGRPWFWIGGAAILLNWLYLLTAG